MTPSNRLAQIGSIVQRGSLVRRLVALSAIWAAAMLLAGAVALTTLYRTTIFRDVDDRLSGDLAGVASAIEVVEPDDVELFVDPADPRYFQTFSGRYWFIARVLEGDALDPAERSRSLWDETMDLDPALIAAARARPGLVVTGKGVGPDGEPLRVRAQLLHISGLDAPALVAVAVDTGDINRDVRRFAAVVAWTLAAFAVALVLAMLIQVRLGLAPVFELGEEVADVREGARDRLSADVPAELAPLAHELNALLDHNKDVVERARAHVGNLAHALKTPISVLRNEAGREEGPLADLVARQAGAMADQVDHHLKRAAAAARAQSLGARAPVAAAIDDLARVMPKIHASKDIDLETERPEDLAFRGERQDLDEMIGNLLDNAFKWARARVRVTARLADPGRLEIAVEDDGPGLPEDQRAAMLKRGARLDETAPGSGLGLSIVDELARAYGGALVLGASALGGLSARLELPAATRPRVEPAP